MRKLIFGMNVTLDGYIAATGDTVRADDPDAHQAVKEIVELLRNID